MNKCLYGRIGHFKDDVAVFFLRHIAAMWKAVFFPSPVRFIVPCHVATEKMKKTTSKAERIESRLNFVFSHVCLLEVKNDKELF